MRYDGQTARIYTENDRECQKQCYRHYRICGEARFAATFFGHALARTVLYIVGGPYNPEAEKAGPPSTSCTSCSTAPKGWRCWPRWAPT